MPCSIRSVDNSETQEERNSEFGNQLASWTSSFIFPGRTPFSVYLEYAGEDRSYDGNYRLGNASLSIGITFPYLWERFDFTYEASEWQNLWYVNLLYGDGLTNDGHVLGHWGGDQRVFGDAVGAQTHMVSLGWEPPFGGRLAVRARTIANEEYANEDYSQTDYVRGYDVGATYSRTLHGLTVGAEILAGRDVFGDSYGRIGGFARFSGAGEDGASGWSGQRPRALGAELFIDAGVNVSQVQIRLGDATPTMTTDLEVAPHFGVGARRSVSVSSDLGVRLELDRIDDEMLLSVRALDYRYRFRSPLALSFFVGASRYDLATPAYGYYLGGGVRAAQPAAGVRCRHRPALLRQDSARQAACLTIRQAAPRPDSFYDISGAALSLSYRF